MKTLAKYHDPLFGTIAGGLFTIDAATVSGGWSQPIPGHCVSSVFFDLAGLSQEEKTIFFAPLDTWRAPPSISLIVWSRRIASSTH